MGDWSRRDELLLLIAVSGELPADWVGRAAGSDSYGAALLTRLKRDGFIKLRSGGGLRGYMLRARGKRYLLDTYPEEIASYLTGAVCTNQIKSEPEKRLRLHRMSMVWVFCHRAGIRIFAGEKPELFPALRPIPSGLQKGSEAGPGTWSYYGTSEWKQEKDKEIKGSRACGILAGECYYVVYNTMDSLMKWVPKTERNLKSRMEFRLRGNPGKRLTGSIIMGTGMDMIKRLLDSDGGLKGDLFCLDDIYELIYFIPFISEAALQLYLLCSQHEKTRFNQFLSSSLTTVEKEEIGPEAGKDQDGNLVYFCYQLELWQLQRIRLRMWRGGRIFCFTYQARTLREIFPDNFEVEAIRPERVYQYLGWTKMDE